MAYKYLKEKCFKLNKTYLVLLLLTLVNCIQISCSTHSQDELDFELQNATRMNNVERVDLSLRLGANPNAINNAINNEKLTALHYVALNTAPQSAKILEILMNAGADINAQDYKNQTPLHLAIQNNSTRIFQELIRNAKINLNIQDIYGWTALHWTVSKRSEKLTSLLLKAGADRNIQDKAGHTALHYAIEEKLDKRIAEIIALADYHNSIYLGAMLILQKKISHDCTKTIRYDSSSRKAIVIGEDVYTIEGQQFTENMTAEQIADHLHAMFLKKEEQKAAAIKIQRFVRKNLKK